MLTESQRDALQLLKVAYLFGFSWLVPCLYVAGCAGTVTCVVVLLRGHSAQKEVRPWFIALSLLDIYVMTIGLPIMYLNILDMIVTVRSAEAMDTNGRVNASRSGSSFRSLDPRSWNAVSCYSIVILHYCGLIASSWVQVGISVLRCMSTVTPFTSRRRLSSRGSRTALTVTLLVSVALAVAVVTGTLEFADAPDGNVTGCMPESRSSNYFYSTFVLRVALPTLCLTGSTSVIVYSMHRFKRTFQVEGRRRGPQQRRISCILVGMNTTFLLCALPYEAYHIYARESASDRSRGVVQLAQAKIVEKTFALLLYANNATNWIFYFVLGKRFRQEMHRIIPCFGCCRVQSACAVHYRFKMPPANGTRQPLMRECRQPAMQAHRQLSGSTPSMPGSPIGEPKQARSHAWSHARSHEISKCHAGHRICHTNFNKYTSV